MRAPRVSALLLIGGLSALAAGTSSADSIDQGGASPAAASLPKASTALKESAIASKVKARLAARHLAAQVTVRDSEGIIWLSGNVQTVDAAAQATRAAMETEGVIAVHNAIVVR